MNKVALITGSSGGLGLVIARGLGRAGAITILNGRDADKLKNAENSLCGEGIHAFARDFDVTDENQIEHAIADIETNIGEIDILINNAGINQRGTLHITSSSDFQNVLNTNLVGPFLMSKHVAQRMIKRKRGKVINICSLMSERGRPSVGSYAAAKGGLKMLTRAMAVDWAPYNIQVNGIGPGYFITDMTRVLAEDKDFDAWLKKRTPAGRWGDPAELIGVAVFLASDASSFINGQVIYVDGGILASL